MHISYFCFFLSLSPSFPPGAGMFVTTMVVGAVVLSKPFMLTRRPYMRDLVFYLSAVYWTFFILWENRMNIYVSLGKSVCVWICDTVAVVLSWF